MSIDLWHFVPNNTMTESVSFLTDVIGNRSGETRHRCRDYPRHEISCQFEILSDAIFSDAKYYAKETSPIQVRVPWWPYWQVVDSILATDDNVLIDNADEYYEIGNEVIITTGSNYVLMIVESVTATSITFTEDVGSVFYNAVVAPVVTALVQSGFNFSRSQGNIIRASAVFSIPYILTTEFQPYSLSGDYPVVSDKQVITEALSELISKEISVFDADVGNFTISEKEKYFRHSQQFKYVAFGYEERRRMRRFINWMKGRYNAFYLPTWNTETDSPIQTLVRSDADRVEISYKDFDNFSFSIPCVEVLE